MSFPSSRCISWVSSRFRHLWVVRELCGPQLDDGGMSELGVCATTLACIFHEALKMNSITRNMARPNAADASSVSEPARETPATSPGATKAQKSPPPESKEGVWLRRAAVLSFWAVVVLLGLPVWWKTTAIYRAELPLQDMTDWAEGKVCTRLAIFWIWLC